MNFKSDGLVVAGSRRYGRTHFGAVLEKRERTENFSNTGVVLAKGYSDAQVRAGSLIYGVGVAMTLEIL